VAGVKETMAYRQLGDTGLEVSVLGLGTVKLGRDQGVKYPDSFKIPDDREALQLINRARELGVNLIDTAPAYGKSEERLGKLLQGQRQDWLICTKVGEEFTCENGVVQSSFDFSPEHIRYSIERSLQRLNTDILDMVLLHSDGNDMDIIRGGALEVLKELKQEGKLRACGMSTKTLEGGVLAAQQSDMVMVTYNLNELAEEGVLDFCLENNKGCVIKKAFASGHFSTEKGVEIADPVQASMDFVLAHQGVSSVIVGTINPSHLEHNIACALKAGAATT